MLAMPFAGCSAVICTEGFFDSITALKERRALLEKIVRRYGLDRTEPFIGEGRPLFSAVCKLDLEGIVAKRMADGCGPQSKWWKIPNPTYSQKLGRLSYSRTGRDLSKGGAWRRRAANHEFSGIASTLVGAHEAGGNGSALNGKAALVPERPF
jgi:hypothetical protein